jgi:uncharacterized membrane protein YedE/YeeE
MEIFKDLDWLLYGILIGSFVPLTLIMGNKQFGISSSMQNLCSLLIPKSKKHFGNYNFKANEWKTFFVVGIVIGGFIAANFFNVNTSFLPAKYYTLDGLVLLLFGGFLVGFGTRYANGCTSGHSITGLSMLKLSSLIATIAFFVGGLIYTFLTN